MKNKEEIKIVRQIETEIDSFYLSHEAMKLPPSVAIQYILIAFELSIWLPYIDGSLNPLVDRFSNSALMAKNKYSLTHSINWASTIPSTGDNKIIGDIDTTLLDVVNDFFNLAYAYHGAVSAYTMWSREVAEVKIISERELLFKYSREECRYDVLERTLHIKREDQTFEKDIDLNTATLSKQKALVDKSVRLTGNHTISYSLRDVDIGMMMKFASNMLEGQTIPPEEWTFNEIPQEHFMNFWCALLSVCVLHGFAIHYAITNFKFNKNMLNGI